MLSRRSLLSTAVAGSALAGFRSFAPAMGAAHTKSYSHAELEWKIKRHDLSGVAKHDLPTPNLVLDKDVFDKNLKTLADHCQATGIGLRSHVKVHRSPEIGMLQIKSGAHGLCCATISECEVMMDAGAPGILWTSQPVGPNKLSRVVALTKRDPPTDIVKGRPDLRVRPAGAEFGLIEWEETDREPKLGDQLELVMSNLDMSVNCFDRMFVCKGHQVVDVFSVMGRSGLSQR